MKLLPHLAFYTGAQNKLATLAADYADRIFTWRAKGIVSDYYRSAIGFCALLLTTSNPQLNLTSIT